MKEKQRIIEADSKATPPYVGLVPYSDRDASFFFGRETETEIISANLRSARLTVLYGTSGVGKSSVLQAGVVHNLRELAKQDLKTYGQTEFAVATYRNWAADPLKGISNAVREAVASSLEISPEMLDPIPETKDLVKILQGWSKRYGLELLIILDQFEELFNYLTDKNSPCAIFAEQLAEVVTAPDLPVRFLISLRSDTLSLLDYFKESIPNLLENRLQLLHLATANARCAITKPIAAYNDLYKPNQKFNIEPQLVEAVIEQIKVGRVENALEKKISPDDDGGAPVLAVKYSAETYVETPYLQLVMKRIWREEVQVGSNTLHLKTLTEKLGGAEEIIQTHLDEVMNTLTDEERRIASKCFKYLVTPMGTKVALTSTALAKYADLSVEKIEDVLELLIKGKETNSRSLDINLPVSEQKAAVGVQPTNEARILRAVEITVGKEKLQGYEVTHDAYIPAILDWRARYVIEHSVINQLKTKTKKALPILAGIVGIIIASFLVWRWSVNSEFADILRKTAKVEDNRNELARENANLTETISSKITENNIIRDKEAKTDLYYKELIPILINLSNDSAAEKDSAIKKLKTLIGEKKVPKEYESSIIKIVAKIDAQKAEELKKAALTANVNPPTSEKQIKPRIYVHIVDENQRKSVESYEKILEANDFNVPGIENVSGIKLNGTQVRYFRKTDEPLAEKVVKLLMSQGFGNIRVQYISGYEDSNAMRPKHLELWFAADAFPNVVNSVVR